MSSSQRRSSEKSSSQETIYRTRIESEAIPEQAHRQSSSKKGCLSNTKASSSRSSKHSKSHRVAVESDRGKDADMTSSSKSHSSSSKKHSSSSSSSKSKSSKSDNWTDVTEPEERRRIQNRLAQRKFREKAKESKERAERDARNQELAGSSYSVPVSWDELPGDDDGQCSGLPWGSISMRHVVSRGSQYYDGSRQNDEDYTMVHDDYYAGGNYTTAGGYATHSDAVNSPGYQQSYGSHDNSSGAGGDFFDDGAYYYNTDYDRSH